MAAKLACCDVDAFFTLAPDWICEVVSRSTAVKDRTEKLPIYLDAGVCHAWLVDPVQRTLEVMEARDGACAGVAMHRDDARVRAVPFDAIEIDLAVLWASIAPRPPRSTRASEELAAYVTGTPR